MAADAGNKPEVPAATVLPTPTVLPSAASIRGNTAAIEQDTEGGAGALFAATPFARSLAEQGGAVPPAVRPVIDRARRQARIQKPARVAAEISRADARDARAEAHATVAEARASRAPAGASQPRKAAKRQYYLEKVVEQGDANDVKFHYARRACKPPNMVDICFMPPENRKRIVVEPF